MSIEERSVTVEGTRISYRVGGTGKPVLCIHGNTGSKLWYERAMQIEGARVVAPDMPNFGDSDHIDTADIDRYADHMRDFIRALELPQPLPVVGHSLGGAVAMSLAVRNPEMVEKLMLVDSAPPGGLKTPEEHYPIIEQYKSNRELMLQALGAVTPTLNDPAFLERLADEAMKMNPIAFSGNARALERFDYRGRTESFTAPVTVVVGDQDALITPDVARATGESFPRATLRILEGVGHSVMVEQPETFKSLVRDFLHS